jgi:hypothetical protein
MALVSPKWKPGINKTDTLLENEGGFSASDRMRFHQGRPQPIGGWQASGFQFVGKARGAHSWKNLDFHNCMAWGTATQLFAEVQGKRFDITPLLHFTVLTDVFTTTTGSNSIRVGVPYHNLEVGDTVIFENHNSTVGGLVVEGTYTVSAVDNLSFFRINHASPAASAQTAAGGNVDFSVPLPAGAEFTSPTGYGRGTYGSGPYGSAGVREVMRVWTLDSFGENLLANPSGYGIAEWQPELRYDNLAFNGDFPTNANGWGLGTGWVWLAGLIKKNPGTGSNLSQNVVDIVEGGRTYVVRFTVSSRTAGSLKFRVNAGSPAPAVIDVSTASKSITKNGTYYRIFRAPANTQDLIWEADSSFNGSIDNISYNLYEKAYFITTAPAKVNAFFVSPKNVVVAIGCLTTAGAFDPNCVRNCAIGNNRLWIPDTNNVASELFIRTAGGQLMAGCATKEQEVVWGDNGVVALRWVGAVGGAYDPRLLSHNCGLASRHSFAKGNSFIFWISNTNDFYIYRGPNINALGEPELLVCPIKEDVFNNFDKTQALAACCGVVSEYSEVWFFYPDVRDGTSDNSRVVACNWIDTTFVSHTIARTAWIGSGTLPKPIGFGELNGLGVPYQHEVGTTANGALLGAWIQTSQIDSEDGEFLSQLDAVQPDFKEQVGNIQLTVYGARAPGAIESVCGVKTLVPRMERTTPRVLARQMSLRFDWVTVGGWGRMGAIRYDVAVTKRKR